jgi:hypothetical protein
MATQLTEDEIDMIAEKAAEKAISKMTGLMYQEVGRTIITKFFFIVGLIAVGIMVGLKAAGIKLGI